MVTRNGLNWFPKFIQSPGPLLSADVFCFHIISNNERLGPKSQVVLSWSAFPSLHHDDEFAYDDYTWRDDPNNTWRIHSNALFIWCIRISRFCVYWLMIWFRGRRRAQFNVNIKICIGSGGNKRLLLIEQCWLVATMYGRSFPAARRFIQRFNWSSTNRVNVPRETAIRTIYKYYM